MCHFGSSAQNFVSHPPSLMRNVEDPLWDLGVGFGQVQDRARHLVLPWEQPSFSFLSEAAGSQDTLEQLLQQPEAVPLPEAPDEPRPSKAPRLHQPRLRPVADYRVCDAQAERQAVLTKWSQIIRLTPRLFDPVVLSQLHHEDFAAELGNLDMVFSKKATNTLKCRASAMMRFGGWVVKNFPAEPISESIVFLYCKKLRADKQGSSAPDQLLQALNFCAGTLGLSVPVAELRSSRTTGLAHRCLRAQSSTKQAQPLTAAQVLWLEHLSRHAEDQYEQLLASSFLLMLYARARHSDIRRTVRIEIDEGSDFITGFVELTVQEPKQSRAARRKRMMLPVVAPLMGIGDRPWGSAWQAARKQWKLVHMGNVEHEPLLPDLAANGSLLPCCMSTSRASSWLRALLARDDKANPDALLGITTHSLKATLLSWAAKASMDTLERTLLGYHSTGVNSSALSYSRDALAGPLRSLQGLLRHVRIGKFNPDDTRSGRWALSSSSAESSDPGSATSTSSESHEAEQVVQGASHLFATLAASGEYSLVRNPASGMHHVIKQGRDRLLCGRSVFKAMVAAPVVQFCDVQVCLTCQSVSEGILNGRWADKTTT